MTPRVLLAVAAGGVLGALGRYGVGLALPADGRWATLVVNATGCLLIGVLAAVLDEAAHPVARAFLGTGVLGGYTTFSAYAVDVARLVSDGRVVVALGLLLATPLVAVVAVLAGAAVTRRVLTVRVR